MVEFRVWGAGVYDFRSNVYCSGSRRQYESSESRRRPVCPCIQLHRDKNRETRENAKFSLDPHGNSSFLTTEQLHARHGLRKHKLSAPPPRRNDDLRPIWLEGNASKDIFIKSKASALSTL